MTSVQERSRPYRKRPFVALSNFFLPYKSDDKLSDQFAIHLELPLAIVPAATLFFLQIYQKKLAADS